MSNSVAEQALQKEYLYEAQQMVRQGATVMELLTYLSKRGAAIPALVEIGALAWFL